MNFKTTPEALTGRLIQDGIPTDYDCWDFVIQLYQEGLGIELSREAMGAQCEFVEQWFETDDSDPIVVSAAWDIWVLETKSGWGSNHVGIFTSDNCLAHVRKCQLWMDLLAYWQPYLIQILRHQSMVNSTV